MIPFFPILHEKLMLSCLHFNKKRLFSKKRCAHAYILSIKRPFCQKYNYQVICFDFFFKTPAVTPFFGQETSFLWKPCFFNFAWKITALMPIFCQNIFLSPKKLSTVLPYFVKKLSIYSKTQCSNVIFFHILMKTLCCHAHILSKKRSLLFKLHYSIGQRSQKDASFFSPDFSRNKSLLSCP